MSTDLGARTLLEDYRIADFKLFLPLGPDVRTLMIGTRQGAFLPHLAGEVGTIDLVIEPPQEVFQDASLAALAALAAPERVRRIGVPEGTYDLIFSDDISAGHHLRPGGVLCRFLGRETGAVPTGLIPVGRWRAYPSWPAFRALIPENPAGWRAAARALQLYPARSATGLRARLLPEAAARFLPEEGIALYRRDGIGPSPTLLASLRESLAETGPVTLQETPADHWLLASGRLGPGNPILAFSLDESGQPQRVIKAARFPGGQELRAEAEQLRKIDRVLEPVEAARIVRPTATTAVARRWALAYDYEPSYPLSGIRWRLKGRARFCSGITEWLANLGRATCRQPTSESAEIHHVAPLRRLVSRRILPRGIQHHAEKALDDLERLAPSLPMILEHGNIGVDNVRITTSDGSDFRILGWGSSTFEGIPLGDLCCLLSSVRAPTSLASRCLGDYLVGMRLPTGDAPALWFSYLARRREVLDLAGPSLPSDPTSGGGVLLDIHKRVVSYLQAL